MRIDRMRREKGNGMKKMIRVLPGLLLIWAHTVLGAV